MSVPNITIRCVSDYPHPDQSASALPHESAGEARSRQELAALMRETPIPPGELIDNLPLYLGRKQLMDVLALDGLYRGILNLPGVIMEFGVRWGRHLGTLTALRAIHEPYNVHRRVVGFDTFTGFPDVSEVDRVSRHAKPGGLAVTPDYENHLGRVIAAHESADALGHVRRTLWRTGDVRQTLPAYLADNPQTIVAFAYFDLDLYEPTRAALATIVPYLTTGSVLAFDQLGHAKWPGETLALRETLGRSDLSLQLLPGFPTPTYLRWQPESRPPVVH